MLGFQCHLVLPTDDPSKPPQLPDGNLLFGTLCGSHLHWMAMSEYSEGANAAMQKVADQLGSEGSYVIPMGGSNALGVCGYVVAGLELLDQYALQPQHMAHKNAAPSYLYVAVGTGGTFAGLLIAAKIRGLELGKKVHFRGILVKGSVQEQKHSVLKLCADFYDSYPDAVLGGQIPRVSEGDFELFEDFVGPGYAKAYDEDFEVIEEAARTEGVMLDPVYTGKAFTGLRTHVRSGLVPPNSTVVFVHTGGSYGWFQRSHLEKYAEYAHSEPQREEHV
jgi:1-aminocyclopropane-1-carboxylate deaminase/D-cysteine desulfhydrase-like pyridoxal-dependent ACC family enzyme